MDSTNYRIRRATLDDIGKLSEMWTLMKYPAEELSKRVTDFQLAEDREGKLVGAVGMQILERQGRIHSEAFTDFSHADMVRPLLWERLNSLATNHGLLRLWTREDAPFWRRCGLAKADEEALGKLPAAWKSEPADWLTVKLRDDIETVMSMDKEFAMFMQAEKRRTDRTIQHARALKFVATMIAVILLGLVFLGAFLVFRRNPNLLRR